MQRAALALISIGLAVAVLTLAPTDVALSGHLGNLLPDLETRMPKDFSIVSVRKGHTVERRLRFDNEIVNVGAGPLELRPGVQGCDGVNSKREAFQRVYQDANGNHTFERSADLAVNEVFSGCMIFHPGHRHWHFDNLARYELKNANGTGEALASSSKVSFCIIDIHHPFPGLAGSPGSRYYTECGRNSILGISIGWSDEYHSTLAGQYIVINGTLDGTYCVLSTADPDHKLQELNDSNNATGVQVTITGNMVSPTNPTTTCG